MEKKSKIDSDLWTSFTSEVPAQKAKGPSDGSEWTGAFDRRRKPRSEEQENPDQPESDTSPE